MGVSGCGKSSVGQAIAAEFSYGFIEGDRYHPEDNVEKMSQGVPLQDDDRFGWLEAINAVLREYVAVHKGCVLACPAHKESYRRILAKDLPEEPCWVFLKGDKQTIAPRMQAREDHYMPVSLLDSQLSIMEEPDYALTVNVDQPFAAIVSEVLRRIRG